MTAEAPTRVHKILTLWPVIVVAAASLIGYGTLQQRVSANETQIEKTEKRAEAQTVQSVNTAVAVAEVKVEVKAVKEQLNDVNRKLDRLLDRQ